MVKDELLQIFSQNLEIQKIGLGNLQQWRQLQRFQKSYQKM